MTARRDERKRGGKMESLSERLGVDPQEEKMQQARQNISEFETTGTITFLGCDFEEESKEMYDDAKKIYCVQLDTICANCSLVNYNKDCHNNQI